MKRILDLVLAILFIIFFIIPFIIIYLAIKFNSCGDPIYWSNRIGRYNKLFRMPKFRSMKIDTPEIATHELTDPEQWLTPLGAFLRKYSLDELPQIISIISGEMSFVGPRPALFNQYDLIKMRTDKGIQRLVPGITGWAQINGRDELSLSEKVNFEEEYLKNKSIFFDIKIIILTIKKVLTSDGVK